MLDASDLSTSQLCEHLAILATHRDLTPLEQEDVAEAARRLSRFAPVKIDPEDEGTFPTEDDADSMNQVEAWDGRRWQRTQWPNVRTWHKAYTHWRRIDNERPE